MTENPSFLITLLVSLSSGALGALFVFLLQHVRKARDDRKEALNLCLMLKYDLGSLLKRLDSGNAGVAEVLGQTLLSKSLWRTLAPAAIRLLPAELVKSISTSYVRVEDIPELSQFKGENMLARVLSEMLCKEYHEAVESALEAIDAHIDWLRRGLPWVKRLLGSWQKRLPDVIASLPVILLLAVTAWANMKALLVTAAAALIVLAWVYQGGRTEGSILVAIMSSIAAICIAVARWP